MKVFVLWSLFLLSLLSGCAGEGEDLPGLTTSAELPRITTTNNTDLIDNTFETVTPTQNTTDASQMPEDNTTAVATPETVTVNATTNIIVTPAGPTGNISTSISVENTTILPEVDNTTHSFITDDNTTAASPTDSSSVNTTATPTDAGGDVTNSTQTSVDITTAPSAAENTTASGGFIPHHNHTNVRIGETNLLLVGKDDTDKLFIELQGKPNSDLTGLWLLVRDVGPINAIDPTIMSKQLTSQLDERGRYLLSHDILQVDDKDFDRKAINAHAVMLALYEEEPPLTDLDTDGLVDLLLFSAGGTIHPDIVEEFSSFSQFPLNLDIRKVIKSNTGASNSLSLSRCSARMSNAGFALVPASPGHDNECDLKRKIALQAWLSPMSGPCPEKLPSNFDSDLVGKIIAGVNKINKCGLTRQMFEVVYVRKDCNGDKTRVDAHFTVTAAVQPQLDLVVKGYEHFVSDPDYSTLHIQGVDYLVHNCTHACGPPTMDNPMHDSDAKSIQTTVGVVLACIAVFMVVLFIVIMYLRRKRKGILQFRMTRLDEEDDDMIGDMDDFVGNQGPTFRNFR